MATEDLTKRVKELVAIELDHCNYIDFPYICHMASTEEGKESIEKMVLQLTSTGVLTVAEALDRIERSYNPNRMED